MAGEGRGAVLLAERLKLLNKKEANSKKVEEIRYGKAKKKKAIVVHRDFSDKVDTSIRNIEKVIQGLSGKSTKYRELDGKTRNLYRDQLRDIQDDLNRIKYKDEKTGLIALQGIIKKFKEIETKIILKEL